MPESSGFGRASSEILAIMLACALVRSRLRARPCFGSATSRAVLRTPAMAAVRSRSSSKRLRLLPSVSHIRLCLSPR